MLWRGHELKRILIIGASGLLGSALYQVLTKKYDVTGTFFSNSDQTSAQEFLDVSDETSIRILIMRLKPDIVINCSGLTNVEECERLPEKAMLLNSIVPAVLARITNQLQIKLVHISTDHFASEINVMRNESMRALPTNRYGYSKLMGEDLVLSTTDSALVIRTNFFGLTDSGNHSLFDFALKSLKANKVILGFEDVTFSPIGVNSFARTLMVLLEKNVSGLLNLCGTESVSKFRFLRMVAKAVGLDESIVKPSNSSMQLGRVERPLFLTLDTSNLLGLVGELPPLEHMIHEELSFESKR